MGVHHAAGYHDVETVLIHLWIGLRQAHQQQRQEQNLCFSETNGAGAVPLLPRVLLWRCSTPDSSCAIDHRKGNTLAKTGMPAEGNVEEGNT